MISQVWYLSVSGRCSKCHETDGLETTALHLTSFWRLRFHNQSQQVCGLLGVLLQAHSLCSWFELLSWLPSKDYDFRYLSHIYLFFPSCFWTWCFIKAGSRPELHLALESSRGCEEGRVIKVVPGADTGWLGLEPALSDLRVSGEQDTNLSSLRVTDASQSYLQASGGKFEN